MVVWSLEKIPYPWTWDRVYVCMALRRRLQITIYSEIIPLLHEGEEGQFQVY